MMELSRTQCLIRGMEIILKYDPKAKYAFEHDIMYFGRDISKDLFPEDAEALSDYGWLVDPSLDSMYHF